MKLDDVFEEFITQPVVAGRAGPVEGRWCSQWRTAFQGEPGRQPAAKPSWPDGPRREEERESTSAGSSPVNPQLCAATLGQLESGWSSQPGSRTRTSLPREEAGKPANQVIFSRSQNCGGDLPPPLFKLAALLSGRKQGHRRPPRPPRRSRAPQGCAQFPAHGARRSRCAGRILGPAGSHTERGSPGARPPAPPFPKILGAEATSLTVPSRIFGRR